MEYERHAVEQPLYGTVNVVRVGDTLLDTGHVAAGYHDAVAALLADGPLTGVDRVVLTHPHTDHLGGSQAIPELAALPHTVYDGAEPILHNFNDHLRDARAEMHARTAGLDTDEDHIHRTYFPTGDYAEERIDIARVVTDGNTVHLGEYECEVVHTPGHAAAHMALWHADSGTLFSADLVSVNGHFMYGPLHADIGAYKESLERVRDLDPDVLVPGHGEVMTDATARIEDAIEKAEAAEAGIRAAIQDADGAVTARALAEDVFGATAETRRFLTLVVCEYLEHLARDGSVTVSYRDDGVVARAE